MFAAACLASDAHAQQANAEQEFFDAIRQGKTEKVNELLQQRPSLLKASAKSGASPVLYAMYTEHPEIAESFIAGGVEPNIFEAAITGRIERVRTLIKQDPTLVKAYSPDGWTALHLNWGNLDIVNLLLDHGADINAVSHNHFAASSLLGAAAFRKIEVARLLLKRGANVNCCGEEGSSPLHEAAGSGQLNFAELLLAHGANINAKDDKGKTPLATALEYKQDAMAAWLRERGGKE
jgi:ankyrin repeat protein